MSYNNFITYLDGKNLMKNKINPALPLFIASAAAAALSVAARIILTLTSYDSAYGVYAHGSVTPTVYHVLLAIVCIAFLLIPLIFSKRFTPQPVPKVGDGTIFTSCICAFILGAYVLLSLYNIIIVKAAADIFDILMLIFAIPAIIFFITLLRADVKSPAVAAFMSFFPTAWCAVYLIRVYFDFTLLTSSPTKTLHELALLSAMVYLLNESRFLLGNVSGLLFRASAAIAPVLLLSSALPGMILSDKLLIGNSDDFICYAVECALALFILSRLYFSARTEAPEPVESPVKPEAEPSPAEE